MGTHPASATYNSNLTSLHPFDIKTLTRCLSIPQFLSNRIHDKKKFAILHNYSQLHCEKLIFSLRFDIGKVARLLSRLTLPSFLEISGPEKVLSPTPISLQVTITKLPKRRLSNLQATIRLNVSCFIVVHSPEGYSSTRQGLSSTINPFFRDSPEIKTPSLSKDILKSSYDRQQILKQLSTDCLTKDCFTDSVPFEICFQTPTRRGSDPVVTELCNEVFITSFAAPSSSNLHRNWNNFSITLVDYQSFSCNQYLEFGHPLFKVRCRKRTLTINP